MGPMIHFCFLKGAPDAGGIRPVISKPINELDITPEQAMDVCKELNGHETIAAWMTSGDIKKR